MQRIFLTLAFCVAIFTNFATDEAKAQSCTASATDVNFGVIDVLTGTPYSTSSNITINCSGLAGAKMRVCVSIGEGQWGSGGPSPRYMKNGGANTLNYNLYTNSAGTSPFGSFVWPWAAGNPGTLINFTLPSTGNITYVLPVFGKVLASQQTVPPGFYYSKFNSGHTRITYDYLATIPCSTAPIPTTSVSFVVQATIQPSCITTATDIDFGTVSDLLTNVDAQSTIRVRCSTGTPYSVAIDGGIAGASSGGIRKMLGSSSAVYYNLFRDVARSQPWGFTIGSNTVAGVGTGNSYNTPVYGRVHPQALPPTGPYSDTLTVTVTY